MRKSWTRSRAAFSSRSIRPTPAPRSRRSGNVIRVQGSVGFAKSPCGALRLGTASGRFCAPYGLSVESLRKPGFSEAFFVSGQVFRSAKRHHANEVGNSRLRTKLAQMVYGFL